MSSAPLLKKNGSEVEDKENRKKSKSKSKRSYEEVGGEEVKRNKKVKRQKINIEGGDCIYLGEFSSKDKAEKERKSKKHSKESAHHKKKRRIQEESIEKRVKQEIKRQESLLKKQELEAKKLERERKLMERKLQIEKENNAKEERKKDRERRRLQKIELEKIKKLRQEEKKIQSQRLYEAKLEKRIQLQAIKKEEKRKKIEEEKRRKEEEEMKAELLKIELLKAKEAECKANYERLAALDDENLVSNAEPFDCPICFTNIDVGDGVILHDCLHSFCKECLTGLVKHSETALIRCPFQNEEYVCESHLQDREVKSLVAPELFEKHLQRSVKLAESQATNSFHCKTSDCSAWCIYEDNVNIFICPICDRHNCLTCDTIHEGKTCKEYQDYVALNCATNKEARSTLEYLQGMVRKGDAMECPQCRIVIMKKYGCDFMTCTMCHTDICWVTKGRRWGPLGQGDISGGCRCKVNGIPCHPKCKNCH